MDLDAHQHNLTGFPGHLMSAAVSALDVATGGATSAGGLLFDGPPSSGGLSSSTTLTPSSTLCPPLSSPSPSVFSAAQHDIYRLPNISTTQNDDNSNNIAGKLPKSESPYVSAIIMTEQCVHDTLNRLFSAVHDVSQQRRRKRVIFMEIEIISPHVYDVGANFCEINLHELQRISISYRESKRVRAVCLQPQVVNH